MGVGQTKRSRSRRRTRAQAIDTETDCAHPVDVQVGAAIRRTRIRADISQTVLADAIGVSFQQVQKYERGTNRVSASTLYDIARRLSVPIAVFFEGLPPPDAEVSASEAETARAVKLYAAGREGVQLIEALLKLPARLRQSVVSLTRQIAKDHDQ